MPHIQHVGLVKVVKKIPPASSSYILQPSTQRFTCLACATKTGGEDLRDDGLELQGNLELGATTPDSFTDLLQR